ncbi:hypothetical protein PV797_17570 [Clostridiaceae bacterium M8S5]|nr:hypothetical protein PV797_17570 [Clostridiaceae bacterium M8S5]
MNLETRVKYLEKMYIGILIDSINNYSKQGVLDKVINHKKKLQISMGKIQAQQSGMTKPEDVFNILAEIFNCAEWKIERLENGFRAETEVCKLCAYAS